MASSSMAISTTVLREEDARRSLERVGGVPADLCHVARLDRRLGLRQELHRFVAEHASQVAQQRLVPFHGGKRFGEIERPRRDGWLLRVHGRRRPRSAP